MKFSKIDRFLIVLALAQVLATSTAQAFPKFSPEKYRKMGVILGKCPPFIGNLGSGLYSGLLPKTSLCGSGFDRAKELQKHILKKRYVVDGGFQTGQAFDPIVNQEGDVQTRPFDIINYPAMIYYRIQESDFKSTFRMAIVDAETGDEKSVFFRSRGSVDGHIAWNIPGRYYFKMNAYGNSAKNLQPVYSTSMVYMDQYYGDTIAARDLKDAGVRVSRCPSQVVDTQTGALFKFGGKFKCAAQDPEDGGMVPAPFNPGISLFLAEYVDDSGYGGWTSFPFRVKGPTDFTYSIDDPTEGKGKTNIYLVNLATGKKKELVDVRGTISGTTTSINIPGDYYISIVTAPSNPEENGDIGWSVFVEGAR